jgi:pyridoxine kinase
MIKYCYIKIRFVFKDIFRNTEVTGIEMKNVLAVHDVSCAGRCSLTVALPIISAFGSTCVSLPTALLSTHTGGFTGFTCLDLTDEMQKIIDAWRPLKMRFDALYSGFLASAEQIDIVKNVIKEYRTPSFTSVIDPVMGDNGQLYKIFDGEFVQKMKELVPVADILIPNITEAALLCGIEYKDSPYDKNYLETLISALKDLGADNIVLTGAAFSRDTLGVAVSEAGQGTEYYFTRKIDGYYHGTGDVFGSVLTAHLMKGKSLLTAAAKACDFVVESIDATDRNGDLRYGVDFEKILSK